MENRIIKNKWKIGSNIVSSGAFGEIYNIEDLSKDIDEKLIIKMAYLPDKNKKKDPKIEAASALFYENTLISGHLFNFPYRPKVYAQGDDTKLGIRYLIMEKLDYTLKEFFKTLDKEDKLYNTFSVGVRILKGLEWLHNKKILLINLKIDNFMIKDMKLYFIDFGIVRLVSQSVVGNMAGTVNYHSLSVSNGNRYTYKDDIS